MPKAKPTTVWLDEEDRTLIDKRKAEFGQRSFTALVRLWLRFPPNKK